MEILEKNDTSFSLNLFSNKEDIKVNAVMIYHTPIKRYN